MNNYFNCEGWVLFSLIMQKNAREHHSWCNNEIRTNNLQNHDYQEHIRQPESQGDLENWNPRENNSLEANGMHTLIHLWQSMVYPCSALLCTIETGKKKKKSWHFHKFLKFGYRLSWFFRIPKIPKHEQN